MNAWTKIVPADDPDNLLDGLPDNFLTATRQASDGSYKFVVCRNCPCLHRTCVREMMRMLSGLAGKRKRVM